jgi:hypothetical protein
MAADRRTTALRAFMFVMGFLRIAIARKSPLGKDVPPSQTTVTSDASHSSRDTLCGTGNEPCAVAPRWPTLPRRRLHGRGTRRSTEGKSPSGSPPSRRIETEREAAVRGVSLRRRSHQKNMRGAGYPALLSLLQARLPQAAQQLSRSRLQRGILVLLFLVVLGDPIEVESRAECRLVKCFERFARLCILVR